MYKVASLVDTATALFLARETELMSSAELRRFNFFKVLKALDFNDFNISERVINANNGHAIRLMRMFELTNKHRDAVVTAVKMEGIRPLNSGGFSQDGIMMADLIIEHAEYGPLNERVCLKIEKTQFSEYSIKLSKAIAYPNIVFGALNRFKVPSLLGKSVTIIEKASTDARQIFLALRHSRKDLRPFMDEYVRFFLNTAKYLYCHGDGAGKHRFLPLDLKPGNVGVIQSRDHTGQLKCQLKHIDIESIRDTRSRYPDCGTLMYTHPDHLRHVHNMRQNSASVPRGLPLYYSVHQFGMNILDYLFNIHYSSTVCAAVSLVQFVGALKHLFHVISKQKFNEEVLMNWFDQLSCDTASTSEPVKKRARTDSSDSCIKMLIKLQVIHRDRLKKLIHPEFRHYTELIIEILSMNNDNQMGVFKRIIQKTNMFNKTFRSFDCLYRSPQKKDRRIVKVRPVDLEQDKGVRRALVERLDYGQNSGVDQINLLRRHGLWKGCKPSSVGKGENRATVFKAPVNNPRHMQLKFAHIVDDIANRIKAEREGIPLVADHKLQLDFRLAEFGARKSLVISSYLTKHSVRLTPLTVQDQKKEYQKQCMHYLNYFSRYLNLNSENHNNYVQPLQKFIHFLALTPVQQARFLHDVNNHLLLVLFNENALVDEAIKKQSTLRLKFFQLAIAGNNDWRILLTQLSHMILKNGCLADDNVSPSSFCENFEFKNIPIYVPKKSTH